MNHLTQGFLSVIAWSASLSIALCQANTEQRVDSEQKTNLSAGQLSAIVTLSGCRGAGTGFIVLMAGKPYIITNQHVLAGNDGLQIKTVSGGIIAVTAVEAATDADIARLPLKEIPASVNPLEFLENPNVNALKDDSLCIPGNSKGDDVITQTFGKLIAIGAQRVEVDNPVYHGNSGSPIIHLKTGKVIGVLTEAKLITLDRFDKASFRSKQSAIKTDIRYFGYRTDTVAAWAPVNWMTFTEMDRIVRKSNQELQWIMDYFTDKPDSYKEFADLHTARNRAAEAIQRRGLSSSSKLDEYQRFLRSLDFLIRRTEGQVNDFQARIGPRNVCYIHKRETEDLAKQVSVLRTGVDIASRDADLTRILIQRGD